MNKLECRCTTIDDCVGDIKERSVHGGQIALPLCDKHLERLLKIKTPEEWCDSEREDYLLYLNNINTSIAKGTEFSALDILEGDIPNLKSDWDRTMCAFMVGKFICETNIYLTKHQDYVVNLIKIGEDFKDAHKTLMLQQLNSRQLIDIQETRLLHEWKVLKTIT